MFVGTPSSKSWRTFANLVVILTAAIGGPALAHAAFEPCTDEVKLVAADGTPVGYFGHAVSISGETLVVGAPFSTTAAGAEAGAAYVYLRSGSTWTFQQELQAFDAAAGDWFGHDVSISGDSIAIGAVHESNGGGGQAGSVYVYVRSGSTWALQQKLTASDAQANDWLGYSVAISGDTIVAGAMHESNAAGTWAGSAYVFVRSGAVWTEQQKLMASDASANENFGVHVAIDGDTLVVGTLRGDAAYVSVRSGGVWAEQQKLTESDTVIEPQFGYSVAISGDTILVGHHGDMGAGPGSGAAFVFVRGGGVWAQQQKLVAGDTSAGDDLGYAVAVDGDTALVGAYRANDGAGADAGAAYAFTRSGMIWTEQQELVASDASADDWFGAAVTISGSAVAIGARGEDNLHGRDAGATYVYGCPSNSAPTCSAGPDVSQSCDGVRLAASASDLDGDPLTIGWSSSCRDTLFSPSDDVLDPLVTFGACHASCDLTLTVEDGQGASCRSVVHVTMHETTPPRIEPNPADSHCLWPPNHWWVHYARTDFLPSVVPGCPGGSISWYFTDCGSSQPADDVGDGNTDLDCLVSSDGDEFWVRAERQGLDPAGRAYSVEIEAVDACGNTSRAVIATIRVPRDERYHEGCRRTTGGPNF